MNCPKESDALIHSIVTSTLRKKYHRKSPTIFADFTFGENLTLCEPLKPINELHCSGYSKYQWLTTAQREKVQKVHVGTLLNAGDAIGAIGLDPGGDPHLHMEIRGFGSSVPSNIFVYPNGNANNGANAWDILQAHPVYRLPSRQPVEPNLMYNITQFFANNVTSAWTQDSDATAGRSNTHVTVSGLGGTDGSLINIGFSCSLTFHFDNVHTTPDTWASTNAAYRGFMYFQNTPATPYPSDQNPLLDPATGTTISP